MKNEDRVLIARVCCDIFEQLAFLFAEEMDLEEAESNTDAFLRASMSFSGERSGFVEIIVPSELTPNLAYNILGRDTADDLAPGTAEDALRELLNTICGRILTSLYGDTGVFDLSVPQTSSLTPAEWAMQLTSDDYITLDVEGNPVFIRITLKTT